MGFFAVEICEQRDETKKNNSKYAERVDEEEQKKRFQEEECQRKSNKAELDQHKVSCAVAGRPAFLIICLLIQYPF